jgi:uncharacterized protein affecting Mg2+/Co2+ transport
MTSSWRTTIRLYRLLMRECKTIASPLLYVQRPLDPKSWGVARQFAMKDDTISSSDVLSILDDFFDNGRSRPSTVSTTNESFFATTETIKQTLRDCFRSNTHSDDISRLHQKAINAIRLLKMQMNYHKCTSISFDPRHHIRVVATSINIPANNSKHLFAYRIRIENCNPLKTVQLLGRSWWIAPSAEYSTPDIENTVFVHAPTTGAVGHRPVMPPRTGFEYMSGTDLQTPTGTMNGIFHMAYVPADAKSELVPSSQKDDQLPLHHNFKDDDVFQIEIAPFALIAMP